MDSQEEKREFTPPPDLSADELNTLVRDFVAGRVFTNAHVRDPHLLGTIFMPLGLGAFSGVPPEKLATVGMIYEYMDRAGPRSINGYPMFLSFRVLSVGDASRLFAMAKKMEEAMKAVTSSES
jgi:hypothetical protein